VTVSVGIDDLNLWVGTLALDLSLLASACDVQPADWAQIDFTHRSVLPAWEDPVTLAVNAAKPLLTDEIREQIGLLLVATETGLDHGKPLSTYVHCHLDLSSTCRNFEVKHACYGGMAALQTACDWVRVGVGLGQERCALVIMTDVARRLQGPLVELTGGAAAVALLVRLNPRVMTIDPVSGCATREVYDVARPSATEEWDDAILSVGAYLDLFEGAWEAYCAASPDRASADAFAFVLYHTPLVGLVRQAHALLVEATAPDTTATAIVADFARRVEPALIFNRLVANVYSASLYVALAGLIHEREGLAGDERIGLFSYGSGACAEFCSGRVAESARAMVTRHGIGAHLGARLPAGMAEYEAALTAMEASYVAAEYVPNRASPAGLWEQAYAGHERLVLDRVQHHHRCYAWS
jgi:3-hydroxy-3-methylglutaryl CoA synthase